MPFLERLIRGGYPGDINLYLLFGIFLFDTAVSYFLFSYRQCLLTAHQRNDIYSRIVIFVTTGEYLLQIAVLVLFRSYYAYILLRPAATILINLACGVITGRIYPQYRCRGSLRQEDRRIIREKISGLVVSKLTGITRDSFDSVFISAFLGLTAVAVYSNYYYICFAILLVQGILLGSISGGVGNSIAAESTQKNFQDFRKIGFLHNWLFSWCTACLLCLYQPFMELWVGQSMLASFPTMLIYYVSCLGGVQGVYAQGNGLWWESRKFYMLEALANVILNWVLAKLLGIFGIMLASVLSRLCIGNVSSLYILFRHYFTEQSLGEEWLRRLGNALITAAVCAVTYGLCRFFSPESLWLTLLARSCICVVVPNVLMWLVYRRCGIYPAAKELLLSTIFRRK